MNTLSHLRHLWWVGVCVLATAAGGWAQAADLADESNLKAAYVFNFIQFIDWPDAESSDEGDWVVCVSPFSPLKRALTALEGRAARKGRPIRIKLAQPGNVRDCAVLVLHGSDSDAVLRAVRALPPPHGILTVADEAVQSGQDAVITLGRDGARIVFSVNTDAAARAGLSISSRLMRLAKAGK